MEAIIVAVLGIAAAVAFIGLGVYFVAGSRREQKPSAAYLVDGRTLVKVQNAKGTSLYRFKNKSGETVDIIVDDDGDEIYSNLAVMSRLEDESIPVRERIALKRDLQSRGYTIYKDFGAAELEFADGLVSSEPVAETPEGLPGQEYPGAAPENLPEASEEEAERSDEELQEEALLETLRKAKLMGFVYDELKKGTLLPALAALAEEKTGLNLNDKAWEGLDKGNAQSQMRVLSEDDGLGTLSYNDFERVVRKSVEEGTASNVEALAEAARAERDKDGSGDGYEPEEEGQESTGTGTPPSDDYFTDMYI